MNDLLQWAAIGMLALSTLIMLTVVAKHDRLLRSMAGCLMATAQISAQLGSAEVARKLRRPLIYCPTHGGQEADDAGRCVQC